MNVRLSTKVSKFLQPDCSYRVKEVSPLHRTVSYVYIQQDGCRSHLPRGKVLPWEAASWCSDAQRERRDSVDLLSSKCGQGRYMDKPFGNEGRKFWPMLSIIETAFTQWRTLGDHATE